MTETRKLLEDYAKHGSEAAFRELVGRYLDLVLSTATRLAGGDSHLAEDIAQIVFIDLARLAGTLSSEVMLGGWLHRHTCFVAAKTMRGERRRQLRERQTADMNALHDHADENLARIAPVLDEAINQLGAEDRAAILLRFFEKLDFRGIGMVLGSNEAAAQKRVSRAFEKLHILLKHRGLTLSLASLGTMLAARAVSGAPAELATRISTTALTSAAATGGLALSILKIMSLTKIQLGLGAIIIAGAATTLVLQHQAQDRLGAENESLREQIAQLQSEQEARKPLPARPRVHIASRPAALSVERQGTNMWDRLSKQREPAKLTREQIEAYLKANGRNPASLLAAFRASDDPALLQEAMDKFPNDPRVDFAAIFKPGSSPEEKRQWLNAFEQSAPENSLANYLSALNYFQSSQADQAVQELTTAAGKAQFDTYAQESAQNDVEAYLAAGYSVADAKVFGPIMGPQTPMNTALMELGQDMVGLATGYQQSGDQASAQNTFQMTMDLGEILDDPDAATTIGQLVGMNIERNALNAMGPASSDATSGQSVQDELDQLAQQRSTLVAIGDEFNSVAPMMSDQDWINYRDREWAFGQMAAEQWIVNKYEQP